MSDAESFYDQIRARRAEIARLREALEREDAELAITEKVAARFLHDRALVSIADLAANIVAKVEPPAPNRMKRKPDGVPSVMRMALDILREATSRGEPWMDGTAIVDEIRNRWWPDAEAAAITPQLWRAASKKGTLLKNGTRYALPHTSEKGSAVAPAEPSQRDGMEGSAYPAPSVPAGEVNGSASLARHQSTPAKGGPAWIGNPSADYR